MGAAVIESRLLGFGRWSRVDLKVRLRIDGNRRLYEVANHCIVVLLGGVSS
jgi:hypothetical protein